MGPQALEERRETSQTIRLLLSRWLQTLAGAFLGYEHRLTDEIRSYHRLDDPVPLDDHVRGGVMLGYQTLNGQSTRVTPPVAAATSAAAAEVDCLSLHPRSASEAARAWCRRLSWDASKYGQRPRRPVLDRQTDGLIACWVVPGVVTRDRSDKEGKYERPGGMRI